MRDRETFPHRAPKDCECSMAFPLRTSALHTPDSEPAKLILQLKSEAHSNSQEQQPLFQVLQNVYVCVDEL